VRAARDVVHVPWHDNAPGLMRHFDVLVAPSHQEPFGTVLSEAMAVGTPVSPRAWAASPRSSTDGVTGRAGRAGRARALAAAVLDVPRAPRRR
jgi:glycosyltransferase involved in cell wall biosynthesis